MCELSPTVAGRPFAPVESNLSIVTDRCAAFVEGGGGNLVNYLWSEGGMSKFSSLTWTSFAGFGSKSKRQRRREVT